MKNKFKTITLSIALSGALSVQAQQQIKMPALHKQSVLADISANHVGVRVADYRTSIKWWTTKLDFRIIQEWKFAGEKMAYLAPPNDNSFWVEILAEGKLRSRQVSKNLSASLEQPGYHHLCFEVKNVDRTIAVLKTRSVKVITPPFDLKIINRRLAFISDPSGNLIEIGQVLKN